MHILVVGCSKVTWVEGIVVDRRLEDLALLFKDVILCFRFKTWSDMNSEYSLVLGLELAGYWLRVAVDGRYNGEVAVWDIYAGSFVVDYEVAECTFLNVQGPPGCAEAIIVQLCGLAEAFKIA